jgi:hypothetical protein
MKRQTGGMLIQDMNLKVGEHFKVGRYTMVYLGRVGELDKWDTIVPLAVWKQRN